MKVVFTLLLTLFFFQGCSTTKTIKQTLQSKNAHGIEYSYEKINELLIEYKSKLDKRNPSNYNKHNAALIYSAFKQNLPPKQLQFYGYQSFENPTNYLEYAFAKEEIDFRSDYLILGLYAMFYNAFEMDRLHKLTAFDYDLQKLQTLYTNLQILQWRIKNAKDAKGNFLFLTWQIELMQKSPQNKINYEIIPNLHFIQSGKENLLDMSNSSFEIITSSMLLYLNLAINYRGGEVTSLSIEMLPKVFLLL